MYIYIYVYAVELKAGPFFGVFSVKKLVHFFFVFENLVLPAERRGFFKKEEKETKKGPISSVKNWSNFVAQHTWTSF